MIFLVCLFSHLRICLDKYIMTYVRKFREALCVGIIFPIICLLMLVVKVVVVVVVVQRSIICMICTISKCMRIILHHTTTWINIV